jgi:hypothetical protein
MIGGQGASRFAARGRALWFLAGACVALSACQDRPLNLLPDSLEPAPNGGMPALLGAGSAGESISGGSANTSGDSANSGGGSGGGGATSAGSGGGGDAGMSSAGFSTAGDAGMTSAGGSSGDAGATGSSAGSGGGGGCRSDADCASPTPGCSLTTHVCTHCSKSSQCPNGQRCSVDDGECGG